MAEARAASAAGDARAMCALGTALLKSDDATTYAEAVGWLRKAEAAAAAEGDAAVRGSALYGLAFCADNGAGVARDAKEAARLVDAAAAAGNAQALYLVAERTRLARRSRCLDLALILCLCAMGLAVGTLWDLLVVLHAREIYDDEISGADNRTTPSYAWRRGVFSRAERADLLARGAVLLDKTSPVAADGDAANPLSDGFSGTRGVVMHFTRAGLDARYGFGHDAYAWLKVGFLDRLLDDRCDAFARRPASLLATGESPHSFL